MMTMVLMMVILDFKLLDGSLKLEFKFEFESARITACLVRRVMRERGAKEDRYRGGGIKNIH